MQKDAEACFRRAIEIAQRQSTKTLELRAATDLCRLWESFLGGRRPDLRSLLLEADESPDGWRRFSGGGWLDVGIVLRRLGVRAAAQELRRNQ